MRYICKIIFFAKDFHFILELDFSDDFQNRAFLIGILVPKLKNLFLKNLFHIAKVNSVQEACAKYFAVHLLKFETLQIT